MVGRKIDAAAAPHVRNAMAVEETPHAALAVFAAVVQIVGDAGEGAKAHSSDPAGFVRPGEVP
jgi:hypothetical protein